MEDLLAPGLHFLGGSPKVEKNWLALQLCLSVCRGEPFLGFKTKRNEVLYISLEDGPRRLHIRALRLTEEAPADLYLCCRPHGGNDGYDDSDTGFEIPDVLSQPSSSSLTSQAS